MLPQSHKEKKQQKPASNSVKSRHGQPGTARCEDRKEDALGGRAGTQGLRASKQIPQTEGLGVLCGDPGGGCPNSRCGQDGFLLQALREAPSPRLSCGGGFPPGSSACSHITLIPDSVCM